MPVVPASTPLPPRVQQAKDKGNAAFIKADYPSAVGAYTDALVECAASAVSGSLQAPLYLNRSLAYLKLSKFQDAERDASAALKREQSTKAYYRRGSARRGCQKLKEAGSDFHAALKMDPRNVEAASALKAVEDELAKQNVPRKAPLDLAVATSAPRAIPATAAPQSRSSSAKQQTERSGSSSVEAARRFLEQVGMSDPVAASSSSSSTPKGKLASSSESTVKQQQEALPHRFPGESGGMLREVSTRRLAPFKGVAEQKERSTSTAAPAATQPSSGATRIASALSFGSATSPRSTSGSYAAPRTSSTRLSAYEFDRRWREASRVSSGANENTRRKREWEFLQSQDFALLPTILGALLEPDLLASLLASFRALLASTSETEQADEIRKHIAVAIDALPSCARFGTAVAFLNGKEREDAKQVLAELESKACLPEGVKTRWCIQ